MGYFVFVKIYILTVADDLQEAIQGPGFGGHVLCHIDCQVRDI